MARKILSGGGGGGKLGARGTTPHSCDASRNGSRKLKKVAARSPLGGFCCISLPVLGAFLFHEVFGGKRGI